jgi:hypothetical protein
VGGQSIPHHQQIAWQVAQQMPQKVDQLGRVDGAAMEPEKALHFPCNRDVRNALSYSDL